MFRSAVAVLAATLLAAPVFAGDAAVGEETFKKCKSCHAITAPDGTEIQKGGKTGPNLYGVVGRAIGSVADFKYGESMLAANAAGKVWDEASIAAYVVDPAAWLKTTLADDTAKSKMTFKLAKGGEDVAAYLASVVTP